MNRQLASLVLGATILIAGCDSVHQESAALTLSDEDVQQRAMQTRLYNTHDEPALLSAAAGVLQDLGFSVDDVSSGVGLLTASKSRDATETGQVVVAAVAAAAGVIVPIERMQRIRVSIVAAPSPSGRGLVVHAAFQRVVRNTAGQVARLLPVTDAQLYRRFFDQLSQSIFLQAHGA